MKIPQIIRLRTDIPISRSFKDEDGSKIYQALSIENGNLISKVLGEVSTIYEGFQRGLRIKPKGNCFGWRPSPQEGYRWMSYEEAHEKMLAFGSGLLSMGSEPGPDCRVGIYSINTPSYSICMHACFMYSMTLVPLYDTLGPDACTYIIDKADITLVICEDSAKAKGILSRVSEIPTLKTIIVINGIDRDLATFAEGSGVDLLTFEDVVKIGRKNLRQVIPPTSEDIALICFTSGTTGSPKGAMLSHGNICSSIGSAMKVLGILQMDHTDIIISYLPLAHVFGQVLEHTMVMVGASIGYFSGDIKALKDDMQALHPTIFPAVPRLLNKICDAVTSQASTSVIKKFLFNHALKKKQEQLGKCEFVKDSFWDKLVFKKIHNGFGGNVKFVISASAPLSPTVMRFARCALGAIVIEGYGQTECAGGCSCQLPGEISEEEVGPPIPSNFMKVVDVPEMEYFAKDGKGEVCIKGPNVFKGYLKDDEKTKEAIDEDGWLHTGDIGMFTERGTLKIIDRKKHFFKLSQGEYVAPEKVENVYSRHPLVAQIFVSGSSLKSAAVAIVVPEELEVVVWAKSKGLPERSLDEMCSEPQLKRDILDGITSLGKHQGLKSFEQVKDIFISSELWSVENEMLTPTFKTKRPAVQKRFKDQIEEMNKNLP